MKLEVLDQTPFQEIIMDGISEVSHPPKLNINVGDGCDVLLENCAFQWLTCELVNNCAEKDTETGVSICIGLTYDPDRDQFCLTIGDDIHYPPDQISAILTNLRKKQSSTIGKSPAKMSKGGIGKQCSENILRRWGGNLTYSAAEDNSILAVATWQKTLFFSPLPLK